VDAKVREFSENAKKKFRQGAGCYRFHGGNPEEFTPKPPEAGF
jgi:hypothetical protein